MPKATYFNEILEGKVFEAKDNKDGTVDLVDAKGNLVVGKCPVSKEPKAGAAVLVDEKAK